MKSEKMYTFLLKIFLSALLLLSFSSGNAMAQTLYGAADTDNNFRSELYTIDPQNGDSTLVGDIGFTDVTGLAFLPDGRLIGLASGPTVLGFFHSILIEINPSTGAGKLIGETNGPHQTGCGALQADISFDRTRNILFGIGEACNSPHHLYTIDLQTGDATGLANSTGFNSGGNGLAVHPQTGTIYNTPGAAGNSLVTLDPGTGIGTLVPGSGGNIPYTINALDFHPATLELYGSFRDVNAGNNFLVKISLTDGKTTTLGPTVPELNAIVFSNFCGDGQLAFNEQCDDGNLIDGDGCESDCTLTPLTTPSPTPSSQPVVDPPVSNGGLSGGGSCSLGLTETPKGMARSFLLLVGITLSMLALFGRRGLRKE